MKYINLTSNDVIITNKEGCKIIERSGYILNLIYKDYPISIDGTIMYQWSVISCEGMIPDKKRRNDPYRSSRSSSHVSRTR